MVANGETVIMNGGANTVVILDGGNTLGVIAKDLQGHFRQVGSVEIEAAVLAVEHNGRGQRATVNGLVGGQNRVPQLLHSLQLLLHLLLL